MVRGAQDREPPNIVFILIDDLGWADLGCYGSQYYETPRIDRLAGQGMRFTDAYAACPACSPTRASILTGRYPARLHLTDWIPGQTPSDAKLQIPDWRKFLPREERTLAEVLKSAGYATAAVGKWHLGPEACFPEYQGFDVNVAGSNIGAPRSYFYPYGNRPELAGSQPGEYLTDRLTDEALAFIAAHRSEPFFLYLAHYAVHTPIQAKRELIAQYREKEGRNGQANAVYAAMVDSVDQSVGRILDGLKQYQLAERTLVILFSDNGGLARPSATSNLPLRSGKGFPFEGGVRVPLIVRWPGVVPGGSCCDQVVSSVDFFPTVLEILGASAEANVDETETVETDGVSLLPVLMQTGTLSRDAVYWHYPHYNPIGGFPYGAVRHGKWKLIEFYEDGHTELYNLQEDAGETTDLARSQPQIASSLAEKLHRWRISVEAQMPRPRASTSTAAAGGETSDSISFAERDEQGFLCHRIHSALQSRPTRIRVLLPDRLEQKKRYPVLYVLPVQAGDEQRYGDGLLECRNHDLHNEYGLICVAPTFSDLPWYADHASDPCLQQERYFVEEVVPLVERNYPVIDRRPGRLLVGFSKSGWGAFSLLLRHPDTFGRAAAWDAPLMKDKPDQFGMGPIFGTQENFEQYQITRLLQNRASQFQDDIRLIHLGYGSFRRHHQQAEKLLEELRIRRRYQDGPQRKHDWHSGWLPEAVGMLVRETP